MTPASPAGLPQLDVDFVRAQFPAFAHPDSAGWAHLENAGGSYAAGPVVEAMQYLFTAAKVQPYWSFGPSRRAGEAMDRAYELLPATFNATPDEVHFGPSTSQNTYVLANAIAPTLQDGDEIVVTNQDHEANSGVWRGLARTGAVVKEWTVDPDTGMLDPSDLAPLLSERTRLVAVTHASNVAATVNPIAPIAASVHAAGGILVVDGVSYAPHAAVDVQALDCDVYLYSTYKTYGPHLGLMYMRRELNERLTSQSHYFNAAKPTARFTPAGPQHAEIGAAAGVVDYYDVVYAHHIGAPAAVAPVERVRSVFELFGAHEQVLMAPLLDFLTSRRGIRVIGLHEPDRHRRAPTVAFHSWTRPSAEIVAALVDARVSCGHGNFYARRLVEAVGLEPDDGVVRLSMVHYNTEAEVQQAMAVLDRVL